MFGAPPRVAIPAELANEKALLTHLGIEEAELKKIWWYRDGMYHEFGLPKGNGKVRTIHAPNLRLKYLQRKIADLLVPMYRVRNPVHGFVIGKSVRTNATSHLSGRYLLNLDLEKFFPTITENRVEGVVRSLGVDRRVAEIVSRICCRANCLPQGAPSSPVISNMICFRLDNALLAVAKGTRCIYTRYADDISFSSYRPLSGLFEAAVPPTGNLSPEIFSTGLKLAIEGNGFYIHPEKVHYADRNSRRSVTGIKINEGLNVDRRFVRNLRAAIHSVEKLGLPGAEAKYRAEHGGSSSLASHLRGKLVWLRDIKGQGDPVFRRLARRFNVLFPDKPMTTEPTQSEIRERAIWIIEDATAKGDQGTAFFLKGYGLVTAAHCVDGAGELELYHPARTSQRHVVTVAKSCDHRDVALLHHSVPASEYFELDVIQQAVSAEDPITALGYPQFGPGEKLAVRTGTISSLPIKSAVQKIDVSQKITQGMSGGPMLDRHGRVVGINHKGGPDEDRDLGIHINELIKLAAE
jgi:S1-C subfamily serine protease